MEKVMKNRPLKFFLLEVLADGSVLWNYDIVAQTMESYGLKSDFQKYSINFDLIEMQASGFIAAVESEIDTEGKFREGSLLNKYKITDTGKAQYDDLSKNIMHFGEKKNKEA